MVADLKNKDLSINKKCTVKVHFFVVIEAYYCLILPMFFIISSISTFFL